MSHMLVCVSVYNVQTLAMIQRFNMRPENTLMYVVLSCKYQLHANDCRSGSSAISPSTRYLVVTNVFDGLDWFDTNTGNYLFTSRLKVTHEAATDVKFLSEHVVAVAYRRNRFIMTTMSNKTSPIFFKYLQGVPGAYISSNQRISLFICRFTHVGTITERLVSKGYYAHEQIDLHTCRWQAIPTQEGF